MIAAVTGAVFNLASVNADRTNVQDVAHAAAIAGVKQLGLGDARGVQACANDFVTSPLASVVRLMAGARESPP